MAKSTTKEVTWIFSQFQTSFVVRRTTTAPATIIRDSQETRQIGRFVENKDVKIDKNGR